MQWSLSARAGVSLVSDSPIFAGSPRIIRGSPCLMPQVVDDTCVRFGTIVRSPCRDDLGHFQRLSATFPRSTIRKKDGKQHRYWSVVGNKRVSGGRVVQKHVMHPCKINSSQELAWRKSIEVLGGPTRHGRRCGP